MRLLSCLLLTIVLGGIRFVRAADPPPDERMKPGTCLCATGKGCWHYLRAPMKPPEDPCRCGVCAAGGTCGGKPPPDAWPPACLESPKVECFWKRHAASWGIRCSRCATDAECAACDGLPGSVTADAVTKDRLGKQLLLEMGKGLRKSEPVDGRQGVVAWSRHFYVACDVPQLRVIAQGGQRFADTHELAHLTLERAEKAYDDFVAAFGNEVRLDKPMAIYLCRTRAKKEAYRAAYFGGAKIGFVYAGAEGKIAGGFCWNGFAVSLEDYDDDRDLHAYCRHMIGHILWSCWHGVGGFLKECPRWAFVGCADWLCKSNPLFRDFTQFCMEEGGAASGSGKLWEEKAKLLAASKRTPIDQLFAVSSMSHLSFDDHVRAWSYMDVMLREDRARWLAVLRKLREGKEHGTAFREGLGMTPEDFDRRWADRLLGRRKTMADVPLDAGKVDEGVDGAERRSLSTEQDVATLGARLRGVEKFRDVETAEAALGRLGLDSDLIRETVAILLERTTEPGVLAWMRTEGLGWREPIGKALVARALGKQRDAASRARLEALLDDPHWLVRANAATALGAIHDPASAAVLVARMDDRGPKAFIAKVDALATYGSAGGPSTPTVVERLKASDWQVRLAAIQALAVFGTADAIEPLIDRLDAEGGRLHREVHKALRAITHETFIANPVTWRTWWKGQKPHGLPPPPPPEAKHNPEDDRYAPPPRRNGGGGDADESTYYGRRIFSQSVLFVLDLSKSMESIIDVPKDAQEKLGTIPHGPRILVAKTAARSAIEKLDERARFNLVFFSTEVRPWRDTLVTAGAARDAAMGAIDAAYADGETNIFGALKASVGLHGKSTMTGNLEPVPDTIYFLTDGAPSRGEITDTETILSWMRDVNRFAKVDLHVIAMGSLGIDLKFLERLAKENHGEFIHIPDKK